MKMRCDGYGKGIAYGQERLLFNLLVVRAYAS